MDIVLDKVYDFSTFIKQMKIMKKSHYNNSKSNNHIYNGDNIDVLKKKHETYNVINKIICLKDNVLKKCQELNNFFHYILNKFKLCTNYEKSLYYLKNLLFFKKRYTITN